MTSAPLGFLYRHVLVAKHSDDRAIFIIENLIPIASLLSISNEFGHLRHLDTYLTESEESKLDLPHATQDAALYIVVCCVDLVLEIRHGGATAEWLNNALSHVPDILFMLLNIP